MSESSVMQGQNAVQVNSLNLQQRILREQVRLIYKQGPTLSLGAAAAAGCITYFSTRESSDWQHGVWLGVVIASAVIRLLLFWQYKRGTEGWENSTADYPVWGWRFAVGSVLAGLVWACWPVLFHADCSTEYLLMISALVAGMVAVLASSGSVYLPAFYCFAIPLCFPLIAWHVASGIAVLEWTGWLLLMFFFVNLMLALRGNRHYTELIEARFRNTDLMQQLEREKRVAETAVAEKNSFIAAASHDLRQPLHALSLFLAALERSGLKVRQQSIVSDMQRSSLALNNHFNSILDISKLDTEVIPVVKSRVALGPLLRFLESDFRADAAEKGLVLLFEPAVDNLLVPTDPLLLERILRNIVGNAIHYTDNGSVSLIAQKQSNSVVLTVTDTGRGIPKGELSLVFNDYHRGTASLDTAGLGLGLSIVRRLSTLLDIKLDVNSTVGEGTRFEIHIPAAMDTCDTSDNLANTPGGQLHTPNQKLMTPGQSDFQTTATPTPDHTIFNDKTVLVIDDEPEILAATELLLSGIGIAVISATSLRLALQQMAQTGVRPDAILCDYRLQGGENGIATIAALHDWLGCSAPACIITGDTSTERLEEFSESGLEVLYKPLTAEQLEARLRGLFLGFVSFAGGKGNQLVNGEALQQN